MKRMMCFTAVEFAADPNVAATQNWHACPFEDVKEGDEVIAPLGRHNRLQKGVVREVRFDADYNAPFPVYLIKYVKEVVKTEE